MLIWVKFSDLDEVNKFWPQISQVRKCYPRHGGIGMQLVLWSFVCVPE